MSQRPLRAFAHPAGSFRDVGPANNQFDKPMARVILPQDSTSSLK
jgi:hypothetical protein